MVFSVEAKKNELVIATTFSPDATAYIISRWQTQPQSVIIRTLNRTSASLEQLLDGAGGENIDLVLTSSPMLLQHLQEPSATGRLPRTRRPSRSSGYRLRSAVPQSRWPSPGFGLLINQRNLRERQLPLPASWDDLMQARYPGHLIMSKPLAFGY
ncbi:Phosphoglycerate transport regulatory protein pgtC precursor [Raoultella planticola]|uniref:Phosphoglycerate transport regulatory protein pgtC n=1 Tax=Raoultella planticola TaxID=575 RepID=A0A485A4T0_RAOPL|nr:Phosphoglycerate transport regulatory protein pgtC precursor [Raoultella planticola]